MTGRITMKVNDTLLNEALAVAPVALYSELRETMFKAFHGHRQYWLSQQSNRFGRGGRGVKVHRVGDKRRRTNRSVHYELPRKRTTTARSAAADLERLDGAQIVSDSAVLKWHQTGGTMRAKGSKLMTIAIAARPADLRKWADKYPERLKRLTRTRKGRKVFMYEITGKRKKRARLRFLQLPMVRNKATLRFYDSWDELSARRDREWRAMSTRLVRAIKEAAGA